MAIDTSAKRFAMLNMASPMYVRLFEVDGAVDADDRAYLLHLYGGNAFSAPAGLFAGTLSGTLGTGGELVATLGTNAETSGTLNADIELSGSLEVSV